MANYYVYILTNKPRGTLYVGVTNDLIRRVYQHREGTIAGFTKRYGLKQLVYFEKYDSPTLAIQSVKRTSSTGRDSGNSTSSIRQIRNGEISIATSRVESAHGCPGQARA
jgi:predicted GIY-YIG superfamily endonuclease